jgi:hypothetical protein
MMPEQQEEPPVVLPYAAQKERVTRKQAKSALLVGAVSAISLPLGVVIARIPLPGCIRLAMIVFFVGGCMGGVAVIRGISVLIRDRTESSLAIAAILCGVIGLAPFALPVEVFWWLSR